MNYVERDSYGMYKQGNTGGPGPRLMGEKLFAVPWKALSLDTQNHCFKMDVSRDKLEKAPGFDKDRWPDMSDPTWSSSIHSYYGAAPYTAGLASSASSVTSGCKSC